MKLAIVGASLAAAVGCLAGCGRAVLIGDTGAGGAGAGGSGAGAGLHSSGPGVGGAGNAPAGTGGISTSGGPGGGPSSGPGGPSSGPGGPGSGPGSSGSGGQMCPGFGDVCTSCLSDQCGATWCGCWDNPECIALIECFNPCNGDEACQQVCMTAHQDGISDLYLASDCAGIHCQMECPGNDPLDPCTVCILEDCEGEMNACLADPECLALYNCLNGCPNVDLACQQACYADHGAGVPTLQAMLECSQVMCPNEC